jgi:hypothetical protein
MYSIFIEMPSGATSKPHEFVEAEKATALFDSFVRQMRPWKAWQATVIMKGNGKVTTEEINNAA